MDVTRAAVVLAAGRGTRFRSELAKVLHPVAGQSMLRWVLAALRPLELDRVVVVVGHGRAQVEAEARSVDGLAVTAVHQERQLGTGHALRTAFDAGALDGADSVLVVAGDAPLLGGAPLRELFAAQAGRAGAVLTTLADDPTGYGRILRDPDGAVQGVVEERDATPGQRRIREVNTSTYVFDADAVRAELGRLTTDNEQGEEYLTDVVGPLAATPPTADGPGGLVTVEAPERSVRGVNDRAQLAEVGAILRGEILQTLMREGVTVVDPATTYVGADCHVEPDAHLLPGTHLEGATTVGAGAVIGPSTRLVDTRVAAGAEVTYTVARSADIGPDARVGPFTYLRPDARLAERSKAGAFVEIKKSHVGPGSKVPHLSYVGDTTIGRDSNVGAATVTVNYDGSRKHHTTIGDRVRIGSDTMLIAPVKVGDDAYTGAGSVITRDVPAGALAVERGEQRTIEGYAERRRRRDAAREG